MMKKSTTIKQDVYESILRDIVNGEYSLDHVFNERTLVEKYKVSRSPIRDALIELCNENILRSIPRYGYEIVRVTEQDVRDIAHLREVIEVPAFLENCPKNYAEIFQLVKVFNEVAKENLDTVPPDISRLWKSNIDFHISLYSFTNNAYTEKVLENAMRVMYRAYSQFYGEKKRQHVSHNGIINEHHKAMELCLINEDILGASQALKRDIYDMFDYLQGV